MKPTPEEVMAAVVYMSSVIRFFPDKEVAWVGIAKQLGDFISTKERLDWFVDVAVKTFPKWTGVPYFIALYATRYELPPDITQTVELPGYSTAELESKYFEREAKERSQKFDQYHDQAKLLAPGEGTEVLALPAAREIPMPGRTDLLAVARSLPSRDQIRVDEKRLREEVQPLRSAEEHERQVAELARELMRRQSKAS